MKSVGEPFNTDLHEAITNIPAPSEELKGKVIDELEKGFGATQIRWFGGEKLRALGKKIAEFQKIKWELKFYCF